MPLKMHNEEIPNLNLTSMIDVLFLLIIFFVLGTRFIEAEKQIELQLPAVADKGTLTAAPQRRTVNVYRDGAITLDDVPVTLEELTKQLAAARSQYKRLGVLVRGDAATTLQRVAGVLNACKQAGIADLGISVRLASTEARHDRR